MPDQIPSASPASTTGVDRSISRRSVLVGSGAGALALMLGGRVQAVADGDIRSFAMVTDVHVNVDEPERTADLERILQHIEDRNPAYVLNCGDITDLGFDDELDTYVSAIPEGLLSRMREIPGNHEQQWLVDAYEAYEDHLGPTRYSFDAAGLHVVGLDPLVMQEWGWYFDEHLLNWLENDLASVAKGTPIIIFLHFPLGHDWNYVHNSDDLLRVIEPYPVRGIFAGHTHNPSVLTYNGATQVVGDSLKNGPFYYWAEQVDTDDGARLEITEVEVRSDGEVIEEPFATVPLTGAGPGGALGPIASRADVDGDEVDLHVRLPRKATATEVQARVAPYRYGRTDDEWPTSLEQDGRRWSGRVDVTEMPPGPHKIQIRVNGDDGERYDDTVRFELPWTSARVGWTTPLDGRVQGALAAHDDMVVAATTHGAVVGSRPTSRAHRIVWRRQIGPVYKGPVFTPDGSEILVPSTDHHLYVLDAGTGRVLRSTDVNAPIASDLALADIDGETCVVFAAGTTVFCLDGAGDVRWRADLGGVGAGRAACDGERVFMGSGDGHARAFDARTGEELWSVQLTDRDTLYGQVLYGPWASHVQLLPGDRVLFTTFDNAHAFDAATGERDWDIADADLGIQQLLYTPPTVTEHGILLVNGVDGSVHLLDPDSGERTWQSDALPRNFGAAPVPDPDEESVYWLVGQSGLLVRIDLAEQSVHRAAQVLTSYTQSTAAVMGHGDNRILVVGAQDGIVRGVTGLHEVASTEGQ